MGDIANPDPEAASLERQAYLEELRQELAILEKGFELIKSEYKERRISELKSRLGISQE
jgi:hypothetical protein